ncbi:MAG: AAA family ATPase, partial [Candidatus Cloacimonetes bacterium]|nr:AAA family ATPase [Candidatus Cloacimonadota bacterium]
MLRYTPPFILENYEKDQKQGSFFGYALLFDIASFTKIGTTLQNEGKRGAEALSSFMDEVFGLSIEVINKHGGFVSLFAGDAFCAIFPDAKPENLFETQKSISDIFKKRDFYISEFGNFDLKIRLTITLGEIKWYIFDNDIQNEYVFYGDPIKELAELSAYKEDVVFSHKAAESIGIDCFSKNRNGYRLITEPILKEAIPIVRQFHFSESTGKKFISARYRNIVSENETRYAAFCFVNLENIPVDERLKALGLIESLVNEYGGFVNKLDATDKGLIALILFGMPISEGKTLDRICLFSLEAVSRLPLLSFGISSGNVFSGYCGSGAVKEYTALGHPVNLAARLMNEASQGEILTDYYLYKDLSGNYNFESIGSIQLKGVNDPINHYRLHKKSSDKLFVNTTEFIGREKETAEIKEILDKGLEGNKNQIVYLLGDAGIGKSRLIRELMNSYDDLEFYKFFLYCDSILQKPLETIKQIVRSFFYPDYGKSIKEGVDHFRKRWSEIAGEDRELHRIESVLASLLDFEWENSVWSLLPAAEKKDQLKRAFSLFMSKLAEKKPIIIHLDDGQWIDEQSKEYFQYLSEKEIAPLIILSACRYLDNGIKPNLNLVKHSQTFINLKHMSEANSINLIKLI